MLARLAGGTGFQMVVRTSVEDMEAAPWKDCWRVIGKPNQEASSPEREREQQQQQPLQRTAQKRRAEDMESEQEQAPAVKKAHLEAPLNDASSSDTVTSADVVVPCKLPSINPYAQRIVVNNQKELGQGDIFLSQGVKERLPELLTCDCPTCQHDRQAHFKDGAAGSFVHPWVPFPLTEADEGESYEPPREDDGADEQGHGGFYFISIGAEIHT